MNGGRKAKATRSAAKSRHTSTFLSTAAIRLATWSTVNKRMTTDAGERHHSRFAELDACAFRGRRRPQAIRLAPGNRRFRPRSTPCRTRPTAVYYC